MTLLVVLGSLVSFVVLLVLFALAMARTTQWLVHGMVERRHRELEEIVTYERLPVSWRRRGEGTGGTRTGAWLLRRRLDRLVAEVQRSTLVADEETRRELLDRLAAVRTRL